MDMRGLGGQILLELQELRVRNMRESSLSSGVGQPDRGMSIEELRRTCQLKHYSITSQQG